MELIKIVFELKSPAIVTKRVAKRGYHIPLDYIPSSMLRGALISSLYIKDIVDSNYLEKEACSPTLITSPAYYLDEEGESYPAHPFIYECKIPHGESTDMYNEARQILMNVKNGLPIKSRQLCDLGHPALENIHPRFLIPVKESFKKVKLYTQQSVNVGISKHRATSNRGMLFEYEAIAEGTRFWASISMSEDLVEVIKPGFEFSIGRGISRGFGKAEIRETKTIDIDDRSEEFERIIKNDRKIVFYALSDLLSVQHDTWSKYPSIIELKPIGERFNIHVNGEISLEEVYGRVSTFHPGWDIRKNMERPLMRSASRGSIAIGRISGTGELSKTLAILSHIGTIEDGLDFNVAGVNILVPLEIHPMVGL